MPFANSFNGDVKSFDYILKVLELSQYFIPGVSCNAGLEVAPDGETGFYYKRTSSSIIATTAGATASVNSVGHTRVNVDLTPALQIYDVYPGANADCISADVVADRLTQEVDARSNQRNTLGISALEAYTDVLSKDIVSDYGYSRGTSDVKDVVKVLYQARKDFAVANKTRHLKPTAILAGPAFIADLKAANALVFKEWIPGESQAIVGTFDGMAVIECDELNAANEFIMLHADAFGAPVGQTESGRVTLHDAKMVGFPGGGTLIAGEIRYNFVECDKDLILKVTA